jgi:hypothetical protein
MDRGQEPEATEAQRLRDAALASSRSAPVNASDESGSVALDRGAKGEYSIQAQGRPRSA